MITIESEILQFLDDQQIPYQRVEHPPVYTCEQADELRPRLPAVVNSVSTKNLFLSDKKRQTSTDSRFYLVMTACEKRLDFKQLGWRVGVQKLRFGSEEKLQELLGVTRGAVTVLGLVNDVEKRVELWVDAQVWEGENFLCHPLVNTATLVLSKQSLERFFKITGHTVNLVNLPPDAPK